MCWLELGGFAHADAAADNVSAPAMADTPPDFSASSGRNTAAVPASLPAHCNGCAA